MRAQKQKNRESVGRILRYVKPWAGRYTLGVLAVATGGYFNSLVVGLYVGGMLSCAQAGDMPGLFKEAAMWLGIMLLFLALSALGTYTLSGASRRAGAALKRDLYSHMLKAPYRTAHEQHSGDLLSRLDNDADLCRRFYEEVATDIVRTVLSVLLGIFTVGAIHWGIAVALVGVGLIMMTLNLFLIRKNRERYKLEAKQKGETMAHMGDLLAGAQLVRIYGEDTGLLQRFRESCQKLLKLCMKTLQVNSFYYGFNQVNAGLTIIGSVGLGLLFYRQGAVSMAALPLLIQMGATVVQPIAEIGWLVGSMQEMGAGIGRIKEILEQEQEETQEKGKEKLTGTDICTRDLCFSYGDGTVALTDVNLTIPSGSVCGIVGYSGSGKSTLLRLLMGVEKYEGSLQIGGREVGKIPLALLRDYVSYVPQECPLFDGTIFENIQLGRQGASREEVLAAARAADMEEFVEKMPQGYETAVGERGVKLSGGQRQRIAIARAMLKDAPILLLDEVTAALDSGAQQRIEVSLKRLMAGRTTLVVAHRLSNVVEADRILVFDKGRLAEEGSHGQLLAADGIYAHLYRLQNWETATAHGYLCRSVTNSVYDR